MYKRIGKKNYDTATARLIGSHERTFLYQKRTGEYFFYEKDWEHPEHITLLSAVKAKEWAKKYDIILPTDIRQKTITITIEESAYKKLKKYAKKNNLTYKQAFSEIMKLV